MIEFYSETDFKPAQKNKLKNWIRGIIEKEGFQLGEIAYVFCDDSYLVELNKKFLKHDTLTDIISFDDREGNWLKGEIYISVERVRENAKEFKTTFSEELHRVMIHGVLHFCGYGDKTKDEITKMRGKEDAALRALNTEP